MNMRFKNFNFDEWLSEYVVALLYIKDKEVSQQTIESEKMAILEKKEFFYSQNHDIVDEYWCQACEYSTFLQMFNIFMTIVTIPELRLNHLFLHFGVYKNFDPEIDQVIIDNIRKLLNTLKIPYNDRDSAGDI